MKKIALTILTLCSFIIAIAQPENINYQALAKNNDGSPIANQDIGIRISIFCSGNLEYQEIHTATTNDIGLYNLLIGNGNTQIGDFSMIDWSDFNKMVEIEIDPNGGINYVSVGSFPFASVPYALYSGGGATGPKGDTGPEGPKGLPGATGPAGECNCDPLFKIATDVKGQKYLKVETNDEKFSMWHYSNKGNIYYKTGNIGIGTDTPEEKLHVAGNICYTGTSAACSDERYKKDITQITDALQNLMKIRGVKYSWRTDEFKEKNFTSDTQVGVIAQDIEPYFPELVVTNEEGYKSVDYPKLTAVLIEAIKEQQQQYETLEKRLKHVEDYFATNTKSE